MNAILPNEFCQITWVKVFKNGPSRICGRQPLKNLKWYGPRKFCWRQALKNLKWYGLPKRTLNFKIEFVEIVDKA